MTWVGIIAIIIILLGGYSGWRSGSIRSLIKFLGLVAVAVLSFQFKNFLGEILIKNMPFFNFAGDSQNVYAVNFLFYQTLAFVVVFLLLYCILNILINISGMVEVLVKMVSIKKLPSKIGGALLGVLEATAYVFVLSFVMLTVPTTQKFIMKDAFTMRIVERTPILMPVFRREIIVAEQSYDIVVNNVKEPNSDKANTDVIMSIVSNGVLKSSVVQEQIDKKKLHLNNEIKVVSA